MRCDVRNRMKFGEIYRKDLLCAKIYKSGYREFDHRGTLKGIARFEGKTRSHNQGWRP